MFATLVESFPCASPFAPPAEDVPIVVAIDEEEEIEESDDDGIEEIEPIESFEDDDFDDEFDDDFEEELEEEDSDDDVAEVEGEGGEIEEDFEED